MKKHSSELSYLFYKAEKETKNMLDLVIKDTENPVQSLMNMSETELKMMQTALKLVDNYNELNKELIRTIGDMDDKLDKIIENQNKE